MSRIPVREAKHIPQEILGTVFLRGEMHAQYPTGLRTLCLLESSPRGELTRLRPTCAVCYRTARHPDFRFSTPAEWGMRR